MSPFANFLLNEIQNGLKLKLTPDQRVEALASVIELLDYLDVDPAAVKPLADAVEAELGGNLSDYRRSLRVAAGFPASRA
jgi:hypothetical protein